MLELLRRPARLLRLLRLDAIEALVGARAKARDPKPAVSGDRLFAEALSGFGHASGAG